MRRFTLHIIVFVSLFVCLPETRIIAEQAEIFSPFVSGIRAREVEGSVVLTWRDSPDVIGTYHIFRHIEEITEANLDESQELGSVLPGTMTYTDHPDTAGEYYYAVLLENPDNGLYELFIPFRNKTVVPVAVEPIKPEEEEAAVISGIEVSVHKVTVRISFNADRPGRSLLVYRHTEPIAGVEDLLDASRVAAIDSDSGLYTDYPIPGISYYYGIFDMKLVQSGTFLFKPSENISVSPVKIKPSPGRSGLSEATTTLRPSPLPLLILKRGIESGVELAESLIRTSPEPRSVDEDTRAVIERLIADLPQPGMPEMEPEVLPQHLNGRFEGAAYTLSLILKEQFLKGDYRGAASSIEDFLDIQREDPVEIAARYYLGQAYYLDEEYPKAFFQFLLAEERYYTETQPWIDRIYTLLRSQEGS